MKESGGMVRVSGRGLILLEEVKDLVSEQTGLSVSYADALDALAYWVDIVTEAFEDGAPVALPEHLSTIRCLVSRCRQRLGLAVNAHLNEGIDK